MPRRIRYWPIVWAGCLSLWAVQAPAADDSDPAACTGQATADGCARPADSERSETPRAEPRKRVPRIRDATDVAPGGSIAPESRRVLPA